MPRIRQYAAEYARNDFQRAIRRAQAEADLIRKNKLAEAAGIPYSTLWKRLEHPETMTLEQLRLLISVLPIPTEAVLAFLGYAQRDIKKEAMQ